MQKRLKADVVPTVAIREKLTTAMAGAAVVALLALFFGALLDPFDPYSPFKFLFYIL